MYDTGIKIYYNYEEERLDLKIFNDSSRKIITVTFEPGYPEGEFEDAWMKQDN